MTAFIRLARKSCFVSRLLPVLTESFFSSSLASFFSFFFVIVCCHSALLLLIYFENLTCITASYRFALERLCSGWGVGRVGMDIQEALCVPNGCDHAQVAGRYNSRTWGGLIDGFLAGFPSLWLSLL